MCCFLCKVILSPWVVIISHEKFPSFTCIIYLDIYIYTNVTHYPMLAQVVYIAYTPLC